MASAIRGQRLRRANDDRYRRSRNINLTVGYCTQQIPEGSGCNSTGFAKIVEGRKDMVSAHRSLVAIKGESNLNVEDYGCFTIDSALDSTRIEA